MVSIYEREGFMASNIKEMINEIIDYKSNNPYVPKYNFSFTSEELEKNPILNKYEKLYNNQEYNIKVILLCIKYVGDDIIPFDSFENFVILQVEDVNEDKIVVINDLVSYKNRSYDKIKEDFEKKQNFFNTATLEMALSFINREIAKN